MYIYSSRISIVMRTRGTRVRCWTTSWMLMLSSFLLFHQTSASDADIQKRQVHHTSTPSQAHTTASSDPLGAWMTSTRASRPNVLFLIADDLKPRLGCYGDSNMVTPNIDNLASRSVLFHKAYSQIALCAPSRTSFLTGRRPDTTRVFDLVTYFRRVAGNFTTLPQYFKQHGYFAQSVGKTFHPGQASSGLDDKLYSWSAPTYFGKDPLTQHENLQRAVHPVNTSETGQLQDSMLADYAIQFLRERTRSPDQPFFLSLGFHKPHLPWVFPQEYLDLYPLSKIHLAQHLNKPRHLPYPAWSQSWELHSYLDIKSLNATGPDNVYSYHDQKVLRQSYSAATTFVDAQVGRVLAALSQYGLADNTIISFLGDHGWHLGDNAIWCKHTNFEMAIRIPMMLHVPGVTSSNQDFRFIDVLDPGFQSSPQVPGSSHSTTELVEAVDLYPTLAELSGLPVPDTCPVPSLNVPTCVEGTSLVPLVQQVRGFNPGSQKRWKKAAFSQYLRNSGSPHGVMGYSVVTGTHRYTEWFPYDKVNHRANHSHSMGRELYNHADDPFEFRNLADVTSFNATVSQMTKILHAGWTKTLQDYLDSSSN